MPQEKKVLAKQVSEKQGGGDFSTPLPFGVNFENVIDVREDGEKRTLAQFYDNYIKFIREAPFIYYGDNQPANSHIRLWIDTLHTNQDIIPKLTKFQAIEATGKELSYEDKTYSDFVGENYLVSVAGSTIYLSGDLYKVTEWEQEPTMVNKYCGLVTITAPATGNIIDLGMKIYVFQESTSEDFIVGFTPEEQVKIWTVYKDQAAYDARENGYTYILDASNCNFTEKQ